MLKYEMKKLFRPWTIAVTVMLFLLFMRMTGAETLFPQRFYSTLDHEETIVRELMDEGYTELTDQALDHIRCKLEIEVYPKYEKVFSQDDFFKDRGIVTYSDFDKWYENTVVYDFDLWKQVTDHLRVLESSDGGYTVPVGTQRQVLETILEAADVWQNKEPEWFFQGRIYTDGEMKRLIEIRENGLWRSLLPRMATEITCGYWKYVLYGIIITLFAVIPPYLTSENVQNMKPLQYSSRRGKRVWLDQLKTSMGAGIILTLLWMILYGIIFFHWHHYEDFFGLKIISLSYKAYWFNCTYLTYFILIMVMVFTLSMCACLSAFLAGMYSSGFISMFLKSIIGAAVMCYLNSFMVLDFPVFEFLNRYARFTHLPASAVWFTCFAALFWSVSAWYLYGWQRTKEFLG